MFVDMVKVFIL